MLGDQILGEDPEYLGPDLADGVHTPVTRLVEGLVCRWVDRVVLGTVKTCSVTKSRAGTYKRIRITPDPTILVGRPGAHGIVRVILVAPNESG